MNNFTKGISNTLFAAFAVLSLLVLPTASSVAHAADYSYDAYDYYGGDYSSYDYSGGDYSYPSYDYYGGSYSYPSYDYYGGDYYSSPSYDYSGSYSNASAYAYASSYASASSYSYSFPSYTYNYGGCTSNCNPPHYCPSGYTGTYPNCTPPVSCPSGYTLQNNVCVPPTGSCPSGYTLVNGVCTPPTTSCPSGYSWNGSSCVPPPPVYNNPTCWLNVSQNSIGYNYNQPITLSWGSNNASYGVINNGVGTVSASGSRTVYPTYSTTYTGTFYGVSGQTVTCSASVNVSTYIPPVYTGGTPYVTLSAVPYTGLDLGPVGTVLYWAFLVLWCFVAAYLIVVKRVQISVYRYLKSVLFGDKTVKVTMSSGATIDAIAKEVDNILAFAHKEHQTTHPAVVSHNTDPVDEFILSQVSRPRHA